METRQDKANCMNIAWSRVVKSLYRREPIVSFVVTIGAVDAAIGGLNGSWSLLLTGLGAAGVVLLLRWWQFQRRQMVEAPKQSPVYLLPPRSSSASLPMLSMPKKNPPRLR